jgi:hypothetical protein
MCSLALPKRLLGLSNGSVMVKKPLEEIEFHPDAMQRFERAAGVVAKSPPQHRVAKKKTAIVKKLATKAKKSK